MNYYDEEITISGPDSKHLSSVVRMDARPPTERSSGSRAAAHYSGSKRGGRAAAARQRSMLRDNSTDDDGLLQDIIDHDDEADDSDDDSELVAEKPTPAPNSGRPRTRPGSSRVTAGNDLPSAKALGNVTDATDSDSDGVMGQPNASGRLMGAASGHAPTADVQLSLTPEQWEQLTLPQELKDMFPYILKYTPQTIETPYHLQPFIPEYVPAVGDVDAMLKVLAPTLLQPQRQQEINEHLQRMGIYLLDEPSGTQSEPSLLNMKLRSVLGGSGQHAAGGGGSAGADGNVNKRRNTSATLIPTAKSPKDIDKWIVEVEQMHMNQAVYDAAPRKDVDMLVAEWPRTYAEPATMEANERAYQQCRQEQSTLAEYVRVLSEQFGIEGPLETQADYILNIQTLFALYLAANQAWE